MLHGTFGGYVLLWLNIVWINVYTGLNYKRATATAWTKQLATLGVIFASQSFLAKEAPHYVTGQAVSVTACGLACCGVWVMLFYLRKKNGDMEKKLQDGVVNTGKGDQSIHCRYQY